MKEKSFGQLKTENKFAGGRMHSHATWKLIV